MANSNKNSSALREALLSQGQVRETVESKSSSFQRTNSAEESRALAIAARRHEMNRAPVAAHKLRLVK